MNFKQIYLSHNEVSQFLEHQYETKTLTVRLSSVVGRVVSIFQIAFIPGRNILEGVVILHVVILQEVMHELKDTKTSGVIIKLDFEKAYDRVN